MTAQLIWGRSWRAMLSVIVMLLPAFALVRETHRFNPKIGYPTFAKREPVLRLKPGDIVETSTLWGEWYERAVRRGRPRCPYICPDLFAAEVRTRRPARRARGEVGDDECHLAISRTGARFGP